MKDNNLKSMLPILTCFNRWSSMNHQHHSIRTYCFLLLIVYCFISYYYGYFYLWNSPYKPSPRIMYIVRTIKKNYSIRLIYLLQTWIQLVHNDVFIISDTFMSNLSLPHMISTESVCGPTSHSVRSLCCQTIHDFLIYQRYQSRYDWLCHFDDDQYVHVNNLREYLSKLDFNLPYYIGRNSWNETFQRRKNLYPKEFWFATLGAGVCLSKQILYLLEPYTKKPLEFINGCIREYYPDDIYIGLIISKHLNLTLTKNTRFHSHLERTFYDDKQTFLKTFHQQITFGFQWPRTIPKVLPSLFPLDIDRLRMRTLHCFLYTQFDDCQIRIRKYLLNRTNFSINVDFYGENIFPS